MANPKKSMEYIWERIPKQKDGKTIRYLKADLDYLYFHGFVNTFDHTLQKWKKAFEPFKRKDESYVLTKEQFVALAPFRYTGRSEEVFDPFTIQLGPWPDDKLKILYDRTIAVASDVNEKAFWAFVDSFKKAGRVDKKGQLVMDEVVQTGIYTLLEEYPSPRRRLEKEVQRIREKRGKKQADLLKNRDKSGFTAGQTIAETKTEALEKLQATAKPAKKPKVKGEKKEEIDIKKLRKPRGKFVG